METMDSLVAKNTKFEHTYGLLKVDLNRVNDLIHVIESTRRNYPVAGDRIVCSGPNKTHNFGHLETYFHDDYSSICTQPHTPFVYIEKTDKGLLLPRFNTSGGYWLSCTDRDAYKQIGTYKKMFCIFGHKGMCAGGAVNFEATVNTWKIFMKRIY